MTQEQSEKRNLRQERKPMRLAGKLDAKLFGYAVAATAAGVGIAQVQPVEAEVVAHPANISVPHNGGLVQFDINGDGQMDFGLSWRSHEGPKHRVRRQTCSTNCLPGASSAMNVVPIQTANEIWQTKSKAGFFGTAIYCAAALNGGKRVGPAEFKGPGARAMYWLYENPISGGRSACPWVFDETHYLGVKFIDTTGNVHYGWVRVSISSSSGFETLTIVGYAYETEPNKAITTGVTHGEEAKAVAPTAPASLGWLAVGALGLAAWRRNEPGIC